MEKETIKSAKHLAKQLILTCTGMIPAKIPVILLYYQPPFTMLNDATFLVLHKQTSFIKMVPARTHALFELESSIIANSVNLASQDSLSYQLENAKFLLLVIPLMFSKLLAVSLIATLPALLANA